MRRNSWKPTLHDSPCRRMRRGWWLRKSAHVRRTVPHRTGPRIPATAEQRPVCAGIRPEHAHRVQVSAPRGCRRGVRPPEAGASSGKDSEAAPLLRVRRRDTSGRPRWFRSGPVCSVRCGAHVRGAGPRFPGSRGRRPRRAWPACRWPLEAPRCPRRGLRAAGRLLRFPSSYRRSRAMCASLDAPGPAVPVTPVIGGGIAMVQCTGRRQHRCGPADPTPIPVGIPRVHRPLLAHVYGRRRSLRTRPWRPTRPRDRGRNSGTPAQGRGTPLRPAP